MKTNTFITFIGNNRTTKDTLKSYKTAIYEFPDKTKSIETPLVGLALSKWLDEKLKKSHEEGLNKIIFFGTRTSSWECLIETESSTTSFKDGFPIDENSNIYKEMFDIILNDSTDNIEFSDEQIIALEQEINKNLRLKNENYCIELRIYPDVKESAEVMNFFSVMSSTICNEDWGSKDMQSVYLDITHGFRHISMFAFTALMFLRLLNKVNLGGMFYADLSNKKIIDLADIFKLFESSIALSKYDASLDLENFYDLFKSFAEKEEVENKNVKSALDSLKEFSFNERIIQLRRAKIQRANLQNLKFNSPVFKEIEPIYLQKIKWMDEAKTSKQLSILAVNYLEKHDYFRSVIYAFESLLAQAVEEDKELQEEKMYQTCSNEEFDKKNKKKAEVIARNKGYLNEYHELKKIRNALAHGDNKVDANTYLNKSSKLISFLEKAYKLFGFYQK